MRFTPNLLNYYHIQGCIYGGRGGHGSKGPHKSQPTYLWQISTNIFMAMTPNGLKNSRRFQKYSKRLGTMGEIYVNKHN